MGSPEQGMTAVTLTDDDLQVLAAIIRASVGKKPASAADFPAESVARLKDAGRVSVFLGCIVAAGKELG